MGLMRPEVAAVDVMGVGDADTGGAVVAGDADVVGVAEAKTDGRVIGVGTVTATAVVSGSV